MDEVFRHAITKMSHIHFPSTTEYAARIKQMGEDPENIYCLGAPGLDNISKLDLWDKERLAKELNIPGGKKWGVITFHPVTLEKGEAEPQINEVLNSVEEFHDLFWVFTMPNADTEGRIIMKKIEDFVYKKPGQSVMFNSLGQLRYLSLLKHASLMVGNSSSGLIEAPSFELPVVNIGSRQKGRIRASNVIDAPECKKENIRDAIIAAISADFKSSLRGIKNPYGAGNTSEKIVEFLRTVSMSDKIQKQFYNFSN